MLTLQARDKFFPNHYEDYVEGSSDVVEIVNGAPLLKKSFVKYLEESVASFMPVIKVSGYPSGLKGSSVYVGTSGVELLNMLLYKRSGNLSSFSQLNECIKFGLECAVKDDRCSFLNSEVGSICIAAVLAHLSNDPATAAACVQRIINVLQFVRNLHTDRGINEVLYGRAGLLYAFLFLQKHLPPSCFPADFSPLMRGLVAAILQSGQNGAKGACREATTPLFYTWHEKEYVGAAHGYAGILHTLLLARSFLTPQELNCLIKPSVDYVLSMQFSSKNFPSSASNTNDLLVQWCHGAAGVVHLFTLAFTVYEEQRYMKAALECGDVVWQRGLLSKGYGLCHGVSGNGYTFLALYNLTQDPKHMHRAGKFAEWCCSLGSRQTSIPDRPHSLYEGLSGVIYFLLDTMVPNEAVFPGFAL